jgi:hypothetical protein
VHRCMQHGTRNQLTRTKYISIKQEIDNDKDLEKDSKTKDYLPFAQSFNSIGLYSRSFWHSSYDRLEVLASCTGSIKKALHFIFLYSVAHFVFLLNFN